MHCLKVGFIHEPFIHTVCCFMMFAIAVWKWWNDGSVNPASVALMVTVPWNNSQIRTQPWPKLSTLGLFQTSAWHYMELGFSITSNWLCTARKSFGKAAECGASGFSGFRDLAHATDGSDGVLVFTAVLFTVEIYEGFTALPAHSALSSGSTCQTRNSVMDSQAF